MERDQIADGESEPHPAHDTLLLRTSVLSRSEHDVLADAARGLTVIESAARRIKSASTVKSQRHSIIQKLEARNIAHAVAMLGRDRSQRAAGRGL